LFIAQRSGAGANSAFKYFTQRPGISLLASTGVGVG
jgi:hypothetical protein